MSYSLTLTRLAGLLAVCFSVDASAHTGITPLNGFLAGALHPLLGLDHLAFTLGIGLWAARPGAHVAMLPVFLSGLLAGASHALLGATLTGPEIWLALTLLSVGIALLTRQSLPLLCMGLLTFLAAGLHGHVHVAEAIGEPLASHYLLGLGMASAVLLYTAYRCARRWGHVAYRVTAWSCLGLGLSGLAGL